MRAAGIPHRSFNSGSRVIDDSSCGISWTIDIVPRCTPLDRIHSLWAAPHTGMSNCDAAAALAAGYMGGASNMTPPPQPSPSLCTHSRVATECPGPVQVLTRGLWPA